MSEKSKWRGFGQLLGSVKPGSKTMTTVEQVCAAGLHQVDSQWTKCPYCEADKKKGERSSRVVPDPPPPRAAAAAPPSRRSTLIDEPAQAAGDAAAPLPPQQSAADVSPGSRRHTKVDSGPVGSPERAVGGGRRIVGVLSTFTWTRLGELYPVRDGRNYAGSGVVSAANDAPCDILVTEDATMSSAHFLILCQGSKVTISDNHSTNGTFVNGEQIDMRGIDLPDNALIKAGATLFTFQKIRVPQPGAGSQSSSASGGSSAGMEDEVR